MQTTSTKVNFTQAQINSVLTQCEEVTYTISDGDINLLAVYNKSNTQMLAVSIDNIVSLAVLTTSTRIKADFIKVQAAQQSDHEEVLWKVCKVSDFNASTVNAAINALL